MPYLSTLEGVFTTRRHTNPRLPLPYTAQFNTRCEQRYDKLEKVTNDT